VSAKSDMAELDDTALLQRVLAREERAWRAFVGRFDAALRGAVRAATESVDFGEAQIDDVIGDVWVSLCDDDMRRLRAYEPSRSLPLVALLAAEATRVAMRHLRRVAREPEWSCPGLVDTCAQ
jgi:sigma54-dependent transcription regulator